MTSLSLRDAAALVQSVQAPASAPNTAANSISVGLATDQASVTDGTTPASVVAGDTGQNGLATANIRKEVSFTTTTVQAVAATDVSNYAHVSVHVVSQGTSSVITFQASNDNTNWVSVNLEPQTSTQAIMANFTSNAGVIYTGPLYGRYFRLNVTGISAGTTAGVIEFFGAQRALNSFGVAVSGNASHTTAVTGNPVRIAGRARTSNYVSMLNDQTIDLPTTLAGAWIQKPYSIPEGDWQYAAASGGIANTNTAVTIIAAAGAGIRNYVTGVQLESDALTNATEVAIRDGAAGTVIWRTKIGTGGLPNGLSVKFATPLKGTANTLMEVVTLTASGAGAVYFNAQGYQAP